MKKKKKNQARKSITAVSAVVAAGLTPGIATGAPAPEPLGTDIKLTAADAVSINGEVYDFDDLFAFNQADPIPVDQLVVLYGSSNPKKDKKDKKKQKDKKIREQEIADSLQREQMLQAERDRLEMERREAMRRDSIQRAIEQNQRLVYGPPRPVQNTEADMLREIAAQNKDQAIHEVEVRIIDYCSRMTDPDGALTPDGDIVRDLKMNPSQIKELSDEIENRFAVQVSPDMIKQLGNLNRIAKFIVEVATPIRKD